MTVMPAAQGQQPQGLALRPPRPPRLAAQLTIGRGVALALGQVGAQDGVVEAVEVGGHAVVALVVVVNLQRGRERPRGPWACRPRGRGRTRGWARGRAALTWAARRTAIFRTMAGARAPNEAGMDFRTFPKVMAPYLGGEARSGEAGSRCWPLALGRCAPPPGSPVQPEAVGGEEQVLGHVVAGDVGQDVARDHPHLGRVPAHAARAGEASALSGAGAADGFPHQARQGGCRRPILCGHSGHSGHSQLARATPSPRLSQESRSQYLVQRWAARRRSRPAAGPRPGTWESQTGRARVGVARSWTAAAPA